MNIVKTYSLTNFNKERCMINKIKKILVPQCLSILSPSKKAFTLAEVLITLGIIGVVASITMPSLMINVNKKQWETASDLFQKELRESLKNMNTAQVISGHPNTLSFVNELANHYKINKICKNNELQNCFSKTVYWGAGEATPEEVDMSEITQASHFGLQDWNTELIGVQFANGVTGLVAYNPTCSGDPLSNQFNGTNCISMLYDTSGYKSPNTLGKDLGNYGVIKQLGGLVCAFEIGGTCFTTLAFTADPISKAECEAIKGNLGIKACYYDDDYWAGAVKQCGGVDKLASPEEVALVAQYIYGSNAIGPKEEVDGGITLDPLKVASLGLPTGNVSLSIGSNDEHDEYSVSFTRYFSTSFTWINSGPRTVTTSMFCVK